MDIREVVHLPDGKIVWIYKLNGLFTVRQHLARLPTIDPNTRTLLLCGFPNVGKSSFINKVGIILIDSQSAGLCVYNVAAPWALNTEKKQLENGVSLLPLIYLQA